jgi:predicted kinase
VPDHAVRAANESVRVALVISMALLLSISSVVVKREVRAHGSLSIMATLHVVCGKAGAGKTTMARALGQSLPAIVFCEDEWIATLGFVVRSLEDYVAASSRCRAVIATLVPDLLRHGVSVVFDFAGNTVRGRAWVRSLFEAAGADHALHWIDASDAECLDGIHRRNLERPAGIYWGDVSDELFHAVNPHIVPPSPDEGFHVISHRRPEPASA